MQVLYFWTYLLFSLVNLYNVILATQLYLKGQYIYFLVFVLYRLWLIGARRHDHKRSNLPSVFYKLELFNLEFIYFFNVDIISEDFKHEISIQFRVNYFILNNILFIYCFRILESSGIHEYFILVQYLNYFLYTLIFALIYMNQSTGIDFKTRTYIFYDKELKDSVFGFYSYTLTIISLSYFYDNYGINLQYYCLMFLPFNYFINWIKYYKYDNLNYFQHKILDYQFTFKILQEYDLNDVFINKLIFFNYTVKTLLLLKFGYPKFYDFFKKEQNTLYCQIQFSIVLLALFFSLIFILKHIIQLYEFIFRSKTIYIRNDSDFLKVAIELNNKNMINQYRIKIRYFQEYYYLESLIDQKQDNEYQFWQSISQKMKNKNTNITISCNDTYMVSILVEKLIDIENIHRFLYRGLEEQIKQQDLFEYIILKRIEKGLINKATMILLELSEIGDKDLILNMLSQALSINLFSKNVSSLMLINPNQILFDLYDD